MLTQERAKSLLNYEPETGLLTWAVRRGACLAGARVGKKGDVLPGQYRRVAIDGVLYQEHRVIHLWMTGEWPKHEIDHDNHVRHDNKWSNIRPARPSQNMCNVGLRKDNKSGVKGVCWSKQQKKWAAWLSYRGKQNLLGHFKELSDAKEFIELAREMCHGEFACHGVAA